MTEATLRGDVFVKACPSRLVLTRIAGKWSLLVIDALGERATRNGALLRRISGISQKMLTETLRDLEGLNLVERTIYETVPPHVEYRLTPLGQSLRTVVSQVDRWVEGHLEELDAFGLAKSEANKQRTIPSGPL